MPEIFVQSIDKRSKLYPSLREMCLNYRFFPFQQLHIEDIAARFSASTTPVREALARLAGEGLIESVPNRGYFAKNVSLDEIRSRVEILFVLLKHSLRSSSHSSPFGEIKALGEPADVPRANRFYLALAALSDNDVLVPEIERQLALTGFIRSMDLENPQSRIDLSLSVSQLLEHLKIGDVDGASACLHQQHRNLSERLPDLVQNAQLRIMIEFAPVQPAARPGIKPSRLDNPRTRAIQTRF